MRRRARRDGGLGGEDSDELLTLERPILGSSNEQHEDPRTDDRHDNSGDDADDLLVHWFNLPVGGSVIRSFPQNRKGVVYRRSVASS